MAPPLTPQTHITYWLRYAVTHVAAYLAEVQGDSRLEEYSFFRAYLDPGPTGELSRLSWAECETFSAWQVALEDLLAVQDQATAFPLVRLRLAGLSKTHLWALMLIGLVELDARFGHLYGQLYPLGDPLHLSIGLLDDLLHFKGADPPAAGWTVAKELEGHGLVTIHHPERPRAAQTLSIPPAVWTALYGEPLTNLGPHLVYCPQSQFPTLDQLTGLLPPDVLTYLRRFPTLLPQQAGRCLILRGMRGCGRRRALGAMARHLQQDVIHLHRPSPEALPDLARLAGALALLKPALPVLELELAPGDCVTLPPLASYAGLVGVSLNREGSLQGAIAETGLTLELPLSSYAARQQQWRQVLQADTPAAQTLVDQASRQYHLNIGTIEQVGQLAQAYGALQGHAQVSLTDIHAAYRAWNQQSLDTLATRIDAKAAWDDLIVAQATQTELEHLIQRCRRRETLLPELGRGFAGISRGVRALFTGASGTGKTLAARVVATALGLDLYRADLAAVVSKYIGETERNLSQLLARAEEQDVILLLDEGDALLTARTDVQNSTDRYANMETNYLLQRLEFYDGIIIITSNASQRIDSAFKRRLDVTIEFGLPAAAQRQRLWQLHLPEVAVAPEPPDQPEPPDKTVVNAVDEAFLRQVSLRCALTGGQIRNAALHATLLALAAPENDHSPQLTATLLAEGIRREYNQMGAISPLAYGRR